MHTSLSFLLAEWEAWAAAADQSDDGWQSDYPRWAELMAAATAAMEHPDNNLDAIEKCWLLSEEDECLADHVRKNPSHYLGLLTALAKSNYPSVRWQVYASLEGASPIGADILESGSADPDAYARRRAIFALAKAKPGFVLDKIDEFCSDPDPDNRLVFTRLRDELSKTTVALT